MISAEIAQLDAIITLTRDPDDFKASSVSANEPAEALALLG